MYMAICMTMYVPICMSHVYVHMYAYMYDHIYAPYICPICMSHVYAYIYAYVHAHMQTGKARLELSPCLRMGTICGDGSPCPFRHLNKR